MAGLDFKRATDVFLGTRRELSLALGLTENELERWRKNPDRVPAEIEAKLASVLIERGRGMVRVGELLAES